MRMDQRFEAHEARDAKLQGTASRIAEEQKVGWSTIAATVMIGALTILVLAYLALRACTPAEGIKPQ